VPRLCEFYPGICFKTEEKHGKTSVRVRKTSVRVRKTSVRLRKTSVTVQYTFVVRGAIVKLAPAVKEPSYANDSV
jgi:hypothetical protein